MRHETPEAVRSGVARRGRLGGNYRASWPLIGQSRPKTERLDAMSSIMETDILDAIEVIRPALQADGGDIVFNSIDDSGVVHVSLVGACGTCPVSAMTLKAGVERIIMDRVPGVTEVVADV